MRVVVTKKRSSGETIALTGARKVLMQGALLARWLPHTSPNGDVVLGRAIEGQMAVEGIPPLAER